MDALESLVERYHANALRLAYLLIGDKALAEDIAQDSFLQAYRTIYRFELGRPFAPWLYRIVTNIARERMRSRRRLHEIALDGLLAPGEGAAGAAVSEADVVRGLQSSAIDPAVQAEQAEERNAILQALDALTHKQREAVILRYYLGCDDHECASIAGCREGAFRVRLHGALQALKRVIRQRYPWLLPTGSSSADSMEVTRHVAIE
jgi:RNA polymerase sigma-70 factor (ECF subfamily)